jgi:hypothetical protein
MQKQSGYYKNVYLTKEDYLPRQKQSKFWQIIAISITFVIFLGGLVVLVKFL